MHSVNFEVDLKNMFLTSVPGVGVLPHAWSLADVSPPPRTGADWRVLDEVLGLELELEVVDQLTCPKQSVFSRQTFV